MQQCTIKKSISCSGVGLHSGKLVHLTLNPAPVDTGIVFTVKGKSIVPTPYNVTSTGLATTLGLDDKSVATVEHLMATLRGMDVDNVSIDIEGNEVPIMDGSAATFVFLLRDTGVVEQEKARRVYRITKPVEFEQDGKFIKARPYNGLHIDYTIYFDHPLIGKQRLALDITPDSFASTISRARTFGFLREVEYLHKNGLALGGTLDNAIVLDDYRALNTDGLRFENEFVRHKILDFIGDMALMDAPLQGSFEVSCSGHSLNNMFLRKVNDNAQEYLECVELQHTTQKTEGRVQSAREQRSACAPKVAHVAAM